MAPERIMNANQGTYTASSDVFSLGVSLFEIATGSYPYRPEKYDSVFAQLNAIVREATPELPNDRFSQNCRDFVTKWYAFNALNLKSRKGSSKATQLQ